MNWVKDFLETNEAHNNYQITKRARHSIHFKRPDGFTEAHFVGKPMHYLDGSIWKPLDTTLVLNNGKYLVPGSPVTAENGTVSVGTWRQHTTRVGIYRPSTNSFIGIMNIPAGLPQGDSLVSTGNIWEYRTRFTEDGAREELTFFSKPDISTLRTGDYLVLETKISGKVFSDTDIEEFQDSDMNFPAPRAYDALGKNIPIRRIARKVNGEQYLYTGIPVSRLESAQYPLVIDPDIEGSSADAEIYGINATYATARGTATNYTTAAADTTIGQDYIAAFYVYRSYLKFNTSSIGTGTVTQVNLKLVCWANTSDVDFDVNIIKQNWSAQDPVAAGNRDAAFDGSLTSAEDDNIWRNTAGIATSTAYTSGNLNNAWIARTGNTYYSLASNRDYDGSGTEPGKTSTDDEYITVLSANSATVSSRPVLIVVYVPSSSLPRMGLLGVG